MLTGSHERLVKDACCHSTGCEVVEAPKRETVRHIHVMGCDRDISRVDVAIESMGDRLKKTAIFSLREISTARLRYT